MAAIKGQENEEIRMSQFFFCLFEFYLETIALSHRDTRWKSVKACQCWLLQSAIVIESSAMK